MRFTWNGKSESFIVLTPQLSKKYGNWQNFYVDESISYAIRTLKVDPDRILLTGLSLGGGGNMGLCLYFCRKCRAAGGNRTGRGSLFP